LIEYGAYLQKTVKTSEKSTKRVKKHDLPKKIKINLPCCHFSQSAAAASHKYMLRRFELKSLKM